jgi:hypothetical protein
MARTTKDERRAVWERYTASWKAKTVAEKRALFETCLAPGCVYTDPLARTQGHDELLAYMLDFHRQIPGGYFETEQFIEHHDRSVSRWTMKNADAVPVGDGISYAEYDQQGRLVAMTGFYEVPAG